MKKANFKKVEPYQKWQRTFLLWQGQVL